VPPIVPVSFCSGDSSSDSNATERQRTTTNKLREQNRNSYNVADAGELNGTYGGVFDYPYHHSPLQLVSL